jgi:hypothetical protein
VLRARQAAAAGLAQAGIYATAARLSVHAAALRIEATAREALGALAEGDTLRTLGAALRRVLKVPPVNAVALRRQLADAVVARAGYIGG